MASFNWRKFTLRIPIRSSLETVYRAWATQEGLESWFLRSAVFAQLNGLPRKRDSYVQTADTYTWLWHGYEDTVVEQRHVLAANGQDSIQFVFSGGCIVSVDLEMKQDQLLCTLTQEMPMDDIEEQQHFFVECQKGWTFYLANLKSILEGGI